MKTISSFLIGQQFDLPTLNCLLELTFERDVSLVDPQTITEITSQFIMSFCITLPESLGYFPISTDKKLSIDQHLAFFAPLRMARTDNDLKEINESHRPWWTG
jgi:hypothetical protein